MTEQSRKWTPGPWVAQKEDRECWQIISVDWGGIAMLHRPVAREHLAGDAALIAAAPDLLAALRTLQAFAAACDARLTGMGRGLSRDFEHGDVLRFARAAIAKAEGRS